MEGYRYPNQYPPAGAPEGHFPDHGDGFGDYYEMGPIHDIQNGRRQSRSMQNKSKRKTNRSRSRSRTSLTDRSLSRSRTSRSHSRSRSRSRSSSRGRPGSRQDISMREPSFMDAFRVLYLTPSKHKNTKKYLATKKRQDRIQEILKSDGLGSKRWMLYPRSNHIQNDVVDNTVTGLTATRDCDQRVKVDGNFLRKYKRSKHVDKDAPIAKLKRWELVFYKKLGFIQAV